MDYRLEPVSIEDGDQIIDIFNYYVENSFAAYPESKVPDEFFGSYLNLTQGYPFLVAKNMGAKSSASEVCALQPFVNLFWAAEITNFISPEHTGIGIGQQILDSLLDQAKRMGIVTSCQYILP